jgi:hypothetical protein
MDYGLMAMLAVFGAILVVLIIIWAAFPKRGRRGFEGDRGRRGRLGFTGASLTIVATVTGGVVVGDQFGNTGFLAGGPTGDQGFTGSTGADGAIGPSGAVGLGALVPYSCGPFDLLAGLGATVFLSSAAVPGAPNDLIFNTLSWAVPAPAILHDLQVVLPGPGILIGTTGGINAQIYVSPSCGEPFTGTAIIASTPLSSLTITGTFCFADNVNTVNVAAGDRVGLHLTSDIGAATFLGLSAALQVDFL